MGSEFSFMMCILDLIVPFIIIDALILFYESKIHGYIKEQGCCALGLQLLIRFSVVLELALAMSCIVYYHAFKFKIFFYIGV